MKSSFGQGEALLYENVPLRFRTSLALFMRAPLVAASAEAATLTVTSTADAGGVCPGANCTLRQAIATAASGDTIDFAAGITPIDLTSGELLLNKSLTINGPGANLLSVQRSAAAGNFRIFNMASASVIATISGLSLINGKAGGALFLITAPFAFEPLALSKPAPKKNHD